MCGSHCYLTRYSEVKKCYVLSVNKKGLVKHYRISFEHLEQRKLYKIEKAPQDFPSVDDMLTHYEKSRIDPAMENIGKCITETDYKEVEEAKQLSKS